MQKFSYARKRFWAGVTGLLLLAGCTPIADQPAASSGGNPPTPPAATAPLATEQQAGGLTPTAIPTNVVDLQLAAARERWQASGVQQYEIQTVIAGDSPMSGMPDAYAIVVNRGTIVRSSCFEQGSDEPCYAAKPERFTVEGLFNVIEEYQATPDAIVTVRYDPDLGFPTFIGYDDPNSYDEEHHIEIAAVLPLDDQTLAQRMIVTPTPVIEESAKLRSTWPLPVDKIGYWRTLVWPGAGQRLIAFNDTGVLWWDVDSGSRSELADSSWLFDGQAVSPDGQLLAVTGYTEYADETYVATSSVKLIRLEDQTLVDTLTIPNSDSPRQVLFSPDGRWLAAGPTSGWATGDTPLWDMTDLQRPPRYQGYVEAISPDTTLTAVFTPASPTSSEYDPPVAEVRSLVDNRLLFPLSGAKYQFDHVLFNYDGSLVAASEVAKISVWNVADGSLRYTQAFAGNFDTFAFTARNQLVNRDRWNDQVTVWDALEGTLQFTLSMNGPHSGLKALAISPDGALLAVGGSFTTGAPIADGPLGTDNSIQLWDLATGTLIETLSGHTDDVTALVFSPDGTLLASAGSDNTLRMWAVK